LFLVACSSQTELAPIPEADWCELWATQTCDSDVRCCAAESVLIDARRCHDARLARCTDDVAAAKSIDAKYDGGAARACLEGIVSLRSCTAPSRVAVTGTLSSCQLVYRRVAGVGSACTADSECVDRDTTCASGTCRTKEVVLVGTSCGGTRVCSEDAFCDHGRCVLAARAGESCVSTLCVRDLGCSLATRTCAAPGPLGAPCSTPFECATGACESSKCVPYRPYTTAGCHTVEDSL
jgi:hypothetical protein